MRIKPIEYEGSLAYFRAWMDRYIALNGNAFDKIDMAGQRGYVIYYEAHGQTSSREIWVIQSRHIFEKGERILEIRRGMILATETSPNKTNVDFVDGQYFGFRRMPVHLMISEAEKHNFLSKEKPLMMAGDPIGEDFNWYAEEIRAGFEFEQIKKPSKNNIISYRKNINLQTKPAGRKVDPWNPIAFNIMNDGKENAELRAFNYWCEQQSITNPNRDDRKNFKKAMKRMSKRKS